MDRGMSTPESRLIREILLRHGSRPDVRMWRLAAGVYWQGTVRERTPRGIVLGNPRRVTIGPPGIADLGGIQGPDGRLVSLEVKAGRTPVQEHQEKWLAMIESYGGIAGIVRSVADVDELLGEP